MTGVRAALYFGCWRRTGHYLHRPNGESTLEPKKFAPDIPWSIVHMDGKLLKNGEHPDIYDGKVFWVLGGRATFWHAFLWWDNSIDHRGASNSGLYVSGFDLVEDWRTEAMKQQREAAFAFACEQFPHVVARQRQPLQLVDGSR